MNRIAVGLAAGLVLGGLVYFSYGWIQAGSSSNVVQVRKDSITSIVEMTGRVEQAYDVSLSFKIPGRIEKVAISEGDTVQEGWVLMELEKGDLERQVAEAQLKLDVAKLQLDREKDMQANVATGQTDAAKQMQLDILSKQVQLAQYDLEAANAQVSNANLVSPISGTILTVLAKRGEMVTPQQPIVTVGDLSAPWVSADIDEVDAGKISVGDAAEVTLDAFPNDHLSAKVTKIADSATIKQGSTVYEASIDLSKYSKVNLKPGMSATIVVTADSVADTLLVPNRAIETVGDRKYVTVIDGNGTRRVEVKSGLTSSSETQILDGLTEKDKVLLK